MGEPWLAWMAWWKLVRLAAAASWSPWPGSLSRLLAALVLAVFGVPPSEVAPEEEAGEGEFAASAIWSPLALNADWLAGLELLIGDSGFISLSNC